MGLQNVPIHGPRMIPGFQLIKFFVKDICGSLWRTEEKMLDALPPISATNGLPKWWRVAGDNFMGNYSWRTICGTTT
jgi:hypothetical protein